ncbi:Rhs family protein [Vibrio penaeicida]|uniref:Rhs family protein n=1 Tax=Vibrio penaeicida TaxID=104609 RepID=UPI001F378423|nr:Rhs family protein [Vibrio penaeicida]
MTTTMTMADAENLFSTIKTDFESSIDEYRRHSENWFYGWALDMEQKVIVNKDEYSADTDDSNIEADLITCPLDGKITLVHCFEAEAFVPIGGTPFKIQPMKLEKNFWGNFEYEADGEAISGTMDDNGFAEITLPPEHRGKQVRVTFYPDVSESDIKTMLDSYDPTISKLSTWLDTQWNTDLRKEWNLFINEPIDVWDEVKKFMSKLLDAIVDAWDEIAELFKLLANPSKLAKELAKYVENPELIAEKLASAKEEAAEMLTLLKDEARCFLCLNAAVSWFKLLSPLQIIGIATTMLAPLLVEVVISIVIPGGAILKNMNRLRDVAGAATLVGA